MKSFKQLISEVAKPVPEDEQDFVDKHEIEFFDHPVALETQFKGTVDKAAPRIADYDEGEDEIVYESKDEDDEKKLDSFSKSKAKKSFKDLKDKDIDNDGDSDESDSYLHNRRKAVTKAVSKDKKDIKEAVEKGTVKLKDGKTKKLSTKEAAAINDLFDGLSAANKKRMEEIFLKNEEGFEQILAFAKEAE